MQILGQIDAFSDFEEEKQQTPVTLGHVCVVCRLQRGGRGPRQVHPITASALSDKLQAQFQIVRLHHLRKLYFILILFCRQCRKTRPPSIYPLTVIDQTTGGKLRHYSSAHGRLGVKFYQKRLQGSPQSSSFHLFYTSCSLK